MAVKQLTTEKFIELIFDFNQAESWQFKGEIPAIIDFYADWCGPCKAVKPLLEELSDEFEGKINIYKVDTESETDLSEMFGIQSIPSFLFIPLTGSPIMQAGAFPKNVFKEVINEYLLNSKQTIEQEGENN